VKRQEQKGSAGVNDDPKSHICRNTAWQRKLRPSEERAKGLAAAGDGRHEKDTISFFEGAGFTAEEADIFFIEVNIEELADLALIVADVAREGGEARSEFVESFCDGGGATVHFGRAVREAAEGGGNFDGDGHF
jgi:hypothetical protein